MWVMREVGVCVGYEGGWCVCVGYEGGWYVWVMIGYVSYD